MLSEKIEKLKEKEEWDSKDTGLAIGIVMARALKNSGQKKMSDLNSNEILKSKSYEELSDTLCENFSGYYCKFLDREKDADVNVLFSRALLVLGDKIKAGEELENKMIQAIIAGYNM